MAHRKFDILGHEVFLCTHPCVEMRVYPTHATVDTGEMFNSKLRKAKGVDMGDVGVSLQVAASAWEQVHGRLLTMAERRTVLFANYKRRYASGDLLEWAEVA